MMRTHENRVQGTGVIEVLNETALATDQAIVFNAVHECFDLLG